MKTNANRRLLIGCLGVVLAIVVTVVGVAGALELGKPAPDFTLPSANGENISLKQFRGQKLVLLEFFGAAFAPI
jgi:uncharacterized membrane protein